MEDQDIEPLHKKPKPKDLDVMSIEALKEYVADLEAEIERAKVTVVAKEDHRSKVDSIFKS